MYKMLKISNYKNGDEDGVNNAFNEVFGLNRSLKDWKWKFKEPVAAIAKVKGEVVGQIAAIKLPLIEGGIVYSAVDVFILPQYRRIGILQALFSNLYQQCPKLIAFPNKMSYPFFIKEGWDEVCDINHYVKRIGIYSALKKRMGVFAVAGKIYNLLPKLQDNFQVSSVVPKEYEALWEKNKPQKGILKNTAYFKWRYDENPNTFYYLYNKNGLIVIHLIENRARVLEVIGEYIHAERWLLKKDIEYIEFIEYGHAIPYKKIRSRRRVLVAKNYSLDKVTFGDTDIAM